MLKTVDAQDDALGFGRPAAIGRMKMKRRDFLKTTSVLAGASAFGAGVSVFGRQTDNETNDVVGTERKQ